MSPKSSASSAPASIDLSELTAVMRDSAVEAGQIAIRLRAGDLGSRLKSEFDVVTDADIAAQEHLIKNLKTKYPAIPIVAEEDKSHDLTQGTFFTVDPIDGTILFNQGGKEWGVLIAYIQNGSPKAGIVYVPERDAMIVATQAGGAWLNGTKIEFKSRSLKESVLGTELGWWMSDADLSTKLPLLAKSCRGIRSVLGSAGSGLDLLTGVTDAYVHFGGAKIWDIAPVALAVQEAGGGFVRMDGSDPSWSVMHFDGVFFSHQGIKSEIFQILQGQ